MGIHVCEFCQAKQEGWFDPTSSGDTILSFDSGRTWQMPDMILHYLADHEFQPPAEFVDDVMGMKCAGVRRIQTKSVVQPTPVGYLRGSFPVGEINWELVGKLAALISFASRKGNRAQTRGAS